MECKIILTKGKRKGQMCKNKIYGENKTICKLHDIEDGCNLIMIKGERKSLPCNRKITDITRKLCKLHSLNEINRPYNPYIDNEFDIKINNDVIESINDNYSFPIEIMKILE